MRQAAARAGRARGALGASAVRRGGVARAPEPVTADGLGVSAGEIAALKAEQARLAAELAQLRALVQRMAAELGIDAA